MYTVKPPIVDPPKYGHCIHCNKQKILFEVPKITCPIVLVHLEPLKEDNLSVKDKTAEFILFPTCPLFGGSTVHVHVHHSS